MHMTRHVGYHTVTGQRIFLIMAFLKPEIHENEIPQRCLVTFHDAIQHDLRDEISTILNGSDGQNEVHLGDALHRRLFHNGGQSLFETLHNRGLLQALPIDNIEMNPMGSMRIPLRQVLEESGLIARTLTATADSSFGTSNHHVDRILGEAKDELTGTAVNLLEEARMLRFAADAKEKEAFAIAPSLKPQAAPVLAPTFPTSDEVAAQVKEDATTAVTGGEDAAE